jgi:hypothetical protein
LREIGSLMGVLNRKLEVKTAATWELEAIQGV